MTFCAHRAVRRQVEGLSEGDYDSGAEESEIAEAAHAEAVLEVFDGEELSSQNIISASSIILPLIARYKNRLSPL